MTIKITLTATDGTGVDFNQDLDAYFDGFAPFGFPIWRDEGGETVQMIHLDTPSPGEESDARAILIEGQNFQYDGIAHTVSGTIETVRLDRLGDAFDTETGNFVQDEGMVTGTTPHILFSGLDINSPVGPRGTVHEIVRGFMGGGHDGTEVDSAPFETIVWGERHKVVGSPESDTYEGTRFGDRIFGKQGNDNLDGSRGRDKIDGGSGNDTLTGGRGNDELTGGNGKDSMSGNKGADDFIFDTIGQIQGDRIRDFDTTEGDRVVLSDIDADTTQMVDQAFEMISGGFTGTAGELRAVQKGAATVLRGDVNGDGKSDFAIWLNQTSGFAETDILL